LPAQIVLLIVFYFFMIYTFFEADYDTDDMKEKTGYLAVVLGIAAGEHEHNQ
jgi:hypothetical protein